MGGIFLLQQIFFSKRMISVVLKDSYFQRKLPVHITIFESVNKYFKIDITVTTHSPVNKAKKKSSCSKNRVVPNLCISVGRIFMSRSNN